MAYPIVDGLDVENDISDDAGALYYEILEQRVNEKYESVPYAFFSDVEAFVVRYGQDVADEAMQNLTGDTASDFVSFLNNRPDYYDASDAFQQSLREIGYMGREYGSEKCREELCDAELWYYDQSNESVKEAMNDIMSAWTGADGLVDFVSEIVSLSA